MKWSGFAVLGAAVFGLTLGTPVQACSGRDSSGKMTDSFRRNMAAAKLRVLPEQPAEGQAAQAKPKDANPASIVGLWDVKFFDSTGALEGEIYDMWHADGTEIEVDASNPINGNVCNGVYTQTNTFTYKLTHPSWNFDDSGNFIGMVLIKETINLDPRGDKYTGTETVDIYDLTGKLVQHIEGGAFTATRVKPV
jgi:hypothetical protein